MPVDLSQIGLTGIEAADKSAESAVTRLFNLAQTQKVDLENQQTQTDINLDKQAAAALAKAARGGADPDASQFFKGQDENGSSAAPLETVADIMLRGGSIKRGSDLLVAASTIRRNEALNDKDKIDGAKAKVETVLKVADAVSQTIGRAQNESEWRYGLAQLRKNQILPEEQLAQLEQMDYNPDVVAYLNDQALTAYQKAQLDLTGTRNEVDRRQADERIANANRLTAIAGARLKLAQQAAARAEKSGKVATAPNSDELKSARTAIVNQVFKGTAPDTAEGKLAMDAGAAAVASRTQALLRENKSLDFDTAQNRAIIESQAAGDWEVATETHWFKPDEEKITGYGQGKTPATALTLPQTTDGKPDPSKLVKNKYYITSKGKAKWTGSDFVLISDK